MQIFATSEKPDACAIWLDDARLNKMVTESAQIICTVLADDGVKNLPFKSTHEGNKLVKWAGDTDNNLNWLKHHHISLVNEWYVRFGKRHGSGLFEDILSHIRTAKPPQTFQNSAKNELRCLDFTWVEDTHLAYRLYLNARWLSDTRKPKWTKRQSPIWCAEAFLDDKVTMMLISRAKEMIPPRMVGVIPCPRCGGQLAYKSQHDFECRDHKTCLVWNEVSRD